MTPYEIIEDIKSDRIKKVIVDCDAGADGDDQFAFALALRSTHKMQVIAVNSAPFNDDSADMAEAGKLENATIAKIANPLCPVPSFAGSHDYITRTGAPVPSEAADNIIKACRESDEPIYVIISGCCTNVASALAFAPDIADKLIVLWLALDNLDNRENTGEYNYKNDIEAGKLLFKLSKNIIHAVAGRLVAPFYKTNQQIMDAYGNGDELCKWLANRFCEITWAQGLWDYCAEGILVLPEAFTFEIRNVPEFDERGEIDHLDETREMVAVTAVDHDMLYKEALRIMGV